MVLHNVKSFAERYERHVASLSLLVAFIFDNLTFRRVDLFFENLRLVLYLVIAALGIAIINLYEEGRLRGRFFTWLHRWLPAVVQFVFGGLFGGFFIFYSRSGSLSASWPFLLVLLALFIGNEFFRKHYLRLSFQISIFFITLFSFAIFSLPIVLGAMGDWVFLLSGIVSLGIVMLFIWALSSIVPARIQQSKTILTWSIGGIFALMNILYFTNILPPIPLALKEAAVYHYVGRTNGGYLVRYEDQLWYEKVFLNPTIHVIPREQLYLYSAVFAPTKLNTQVVHHWQYYDENQGAWISQSRAQFSIVGGRDGGYRGYSLNNRLFPGLWRVDIETKRGQLIGRVTFNVEQVSQRPLLREDVR